MKTIETKARESVLGGVAVGAMLGVLAGIWIGVVGTEVRVIEQCTSDRLVIFDRYVHDRPVWVTCRVSAKKGGAA